MSVERARPSLCCCMISMPGFVCFSCSTRVPRKKSYKELEEENRVLKRKVEELYDDLTFHVAEAVEQTRRELEILESRREWEPEDPEDIETYIASVEI